ncbi:hypothetical protein H5410_026837 [Solanum commersonii]|uniref:Uncharacterized protein n=1 Tax=Solanum commersonii TaxID=4109 RepID=A0A9J5YXM5_SOLCO|nr:hypothetical protein H5410_026837 [Solanum commersonii]
MMQFCDRDSPYPLLEIVGDGQQNPNAKVLLLEVQAPAIGIFSLTGGHPKGRIKSQVKSNDTPQVTKTSSMSKTSKYGDMPPKSKCRRLTLASKATSPASKVGHGSSDTNELHVSSNNDTIVIDDNDFVDEDPNSSSLSELEKQLDLIKLYGDDLGNGIFADFTIDLNDLDVAAKYFHSSINDVMPSLEIVPPGKSPSTSSDEKKFPNQMTKQFSLGSLDGLIELESSIASTLEEIRKVDIIDVSSLEDLVENFFKSYAEYNTLRSSKMTKESHEKALSDAQRRLDGAKLAHEKLDGSMGKLQATLTDVEKDLKALTSKKKKITALINKYQEKLYKGQENVIITKGEIYTIEADHMLSDDEVERLADLEGAVQKSHQEIISFKLFP